MAGSGSGERRSSKATMAASLLACHSVTGRPVTVAGKSPTESDRAASSAMTDTVGVSTPEACGGSPSGSTRGPATLTDAAPSSQSMADSGCCAAAAGAIRKAAISASIRLKYDVLANFLGRRGEIRAEKRPDICIAHKRDERQNGEVEQPFDQSQHVGPACLCRYFCMFITGLLGKITSFSGKARNIAKGAQNVTAPERWKLKKTVVLVGMMGAGKTAVGKALAVRLAVPFLDSDAEIEQAANMSIAEIFARDGEAFLSERNRNLISRKGVSVWLKADLALLWSRVKHKDTRPLLRTADPYGTLRDLYETRLPFYQEADLTVTAQPDYSIDTMAEKVLEALTTREDVLEGLT